MENNHVAVAVYDPATGYIKQVVRCLSKDAVHQGTGWPDHHVVDVTGHPDPHPMKHMVCLKTKKLLPRVAPKAEVVREKHRELEQAHEKSRNSFLSGGRYYRSLPEDQHDILLAAQTGGDLVVLKDPNMPGDWSLVTVTAAQAAVILKDYAAHKTLAKRRFLHHKARAETVNDPASVNWEDNLPQK